MAKLKDLTGKRFGKLVVLNRDFEAKNYKTKWICKCDCGNTTSVWQYHLTNGETKSCGCLLREKKPWMKKDLTGKKFGRWNVIEYASKKGHENYWLCECDCGTIKEVSQSSLQSGKTKSCGCITKEISARNLQIYLSKKRCVRHNDNTYKRIYRILYGMKKRCYNQNEDAYKNYGGRGIKVCDEWLNSANAFYEWAIKHGYDDSMTIERIDVNGDYEPSNCIFIPKKQQVRNRRNTVMLKIGEEEKPLAEWCDIYGCSYDTVYNRLYYSKIPVEYAFSKEDLRKVKVYGKIKDDDRKDREYIE